MEDLYLEFWSQYVTFVREKAWDIETSKKPADHYYYDSSFGEGGIYLSSYINKNTNELFTGIYIKESHLAKFHQLQKNRVKIEKILGYVKWVPDTGKGVTRIKQVLKIDLQLKSNWEEAFTWLGLRSLLFKEVVKVYVHSKEKSTKK